MTPESWDWVGDLIGQRAMLNPSREAIIDLDSGIHYTYGDLNNRANRLANYLANKFNIRKGDRVAFLSRNRIEMFDGIFACGKLGAIFVPYNIRLTPGELSKLLENEEPKVLFYEEIFEPAVLKLKHPSFSMYYVVLTDEKLHPEQDRNNMDYTEIMSHANNSPRKCRGLDLEDIYLLLHTGGTTGLPKGAMISYRAVLYNQLNTILDTGVNWDKTAHLFMPLFHTGGWNFVTLAILKAGGRLLINRTFDPKLVLRVINEYKPNFVFAAATILRMIIDQPEFETTDWSTVEWVISGAAPTPVQLMEKFWEKGIKIGLAYGLTEGGPTNLVIPVNLMSIMELREKHASVGKPFSFTVAKIVDDYGREVGVEETGEIIFSGPQIFSGYWRNEEETKKTLRDGWVYTGDMGKQDKDGFYYIVGRKKNMFISGGENVFPSEIETELYQIAEVHECCVIGVPDSKWGEVGKAIIALKPVQHISKEQVIAFLKTRLAPYKVPKYVTFVDEIPKNSAGKIVVQEAVRLYGKPQDD
ncbi:class I adenylate-forming enzyme family protein [Paradesulfitobacterium ferrireducens]|uniref:class I adenylate-forming enzyme family protein n=1 Tax=Paradesulfitobacterium ferrireducens TaxID=2816476 RepID=UPI001A8EE04D|nr:AMP-binding protein [Paradesulfitobacterium ferrireducens]